jgi:Host cell surface-exposed lipoprotein
MWKWIIGGIVALALIGAVAGGSGEDETGQPSKAIENVTKEADKAAEQVEKSEPAPEPEPAQPAEPEMTSGQENAVESAQDYLEYSGFSRKGLIQQLSSSAGEGFSTADATFAVDHVDVNWNEEAVESAKDYLDYSSFSRDGLIGQLTSSAGEGFTLAQAHYAVDQVY